VLKRKLAKIALIFSLVSIVSFNLTYAEGEKAPELKKVCLDGQIKRITITVQSESHPYNRYRHLNLCEKSEDGLPQIINNSIKKLSDLNQEVASFLKVPMKELFTEMISLHLHEDTLGELSSRVLMSSSLSLGYFSKVNFQTENYINNSVYIHELGHILTIQKKSLPKIFADLEYKRVPRPFTEFFSDVLAMAVTGSVITSNDNFHSCFQDLRKVDKAHNYHAMDYVFRKDYPMNEVKHCCQKITLTPESITQNDQGICKDYKNKKMTSSKKKHSYPFKTFPVSYKTNLLKYDSHNIGTPIVSFLKRLESLFGIKNIWKIVFEEADALSKKPEELNTSFQCGYNSFGSTDQGYTITNEVSQISEIFQVIKNRIIQQTQDSLSSEEVNSSWNTLWNSYGMSKIKNFMDEESKDFAKILTQKEFRNIKKKKPKIFQKLSLKEQKCAKKKYDRKNACHIYCQEK
jgi:hypothetical protein